MPYRTPAVVISQNNQPEQPPWFVVSAMVPVAIAVCVGVGIGLSVLPVDYQRPVICPEHTCCSDNSLSN
jgi:hypothetical protein